MEIYVGEKRLHSQSVDVTGELVNLDGESYYKISNYDRMRPFLMSLTSDSDIWMFVSSKGGLTAGRRTSDQAIFPYYTDDQLTELSESTGSTTVVLVQKGETKQLWCPFSDKYQGLYRIERNIYKNAIGNKLIFEEINSDLGLRYRYRWCNSRRFGIIKKAEIVNLTADLCQINVLDGLENLMPPGILQSVQQTKSNLAGAYKKSELRSFSGIGIYSLSSNIIDRPEPSEALKATTVWCSGLNGKRLLCSNQVRKFMAGVEVEEELEMRAESGAYLISSKLALEPNSSSQWYFIADTLQTAVDIAELEGLITSGQSTAKLIEEEIARSSDNLMNIISRIDGRQISKDAPGNMRHMSNCLFNAMRGGFFSNGYLIGKSDFVRFISSKDRQIAEKYKVVLDSLPSKLNVDELKTKLAKSADGILERYIYEYLPVTFSRRHGDPSRPWNRFNIDVLDEDGDWKKSYEGNWRDIFQNWEALCYSYPGFTENVITIFLNASTIDGYNPYRITSRGFEWEKTDPEDPWSFIGYWGDHQIIYLLKLLEISARFHPGRLEEFLEKPFFTFANVPYRIKEYSRILQNPYDTIIYDEAEEIEIAERVKQIGSDGKCLWHAGDLVLVSLTEKLLLPLLTKLSNFVPEGGIWMNTQRPEWNDANNALVGHGLSMVTVYYVYRYLDFLKSMIVRVENERFEIGVELEEFFKSINRVLDQSSVLLNSDISDQDRQVITDALGIAGESYRLRVYSDFSGDKTLLEKNDLLHFLQLAKDFLEHTIGKNKRQDGLYHAYNLIEFYNSGFGIKTLYPMLEGQVAVLSSGFINPQEAVEVLEALKKGPLYREDQKSYILYPDRHLKAFMDKTRIKKDDVGKSKLLLQLLNSRDKSIIRQDVLGDYHFSESLCNAKDLDVALEKLDKSKYSALSEGERDLILKLYESVFNHHEFTGRSGTFFGYEGLGSIYWHMNSKLLLAVQEVLQRAVDSHENDVVTRRLKEHFLEIKEGLGVHKSPEVYGAFPTDPYSHTPAGKGAQQPGMTGQVKEDILSRIGELGVRVIEGRITFSNAFLNESEFITDPRQLTGFGIPDLTLDNFLAFTFCGVPVVYSRISDQEKIVVNYKQGQKQTLEGLVLNREESVRVFSRDESLSYIHVFFRS